MVAYDAMPPEVSSGLVYTGPQSAPLAAAAAAWQALAADLQATATAMQAAVANLVGATWTGPTSVSMGGAGEQHVQWLVQSAALAEETAALAGQAATVVEAVFTGVVPPPLIAANRAALVALLGSNFMNCNSGAIAANIGQYQGMWAQDSTALYGYAGDSAATVGGLVPFIPLAPTVNPAGAADQAMAVSQSAAQAAGNAGQKAASATNQLTGNTSSTAGGGMDIMTMAPQFLSSVPQVLQGMASPLMSANPMSSMGSFTSLLSPFMSGLGGSGLGGTSALAATTSPLSSALGGAGGGLSGIGGGAGGLSAAMGGASKLGGLSVPATWAASAQSAGGANNATSATSGINANSAAAPGGGSGMGGAAPMGAAMNGRNQSGGHGPSYGSPIRVLPRPR